MEILVAALAEHGLAGGMAAAFLAALGWIAKRYITHLERSDERWREIVTLQGGEVRELRTTIDAHESSERTRHAEVIGAIRARRTT